ncbi:MAG TPA: MopE-related protein [Polyangiaceae bacterium]|nr:MopE-related protein [Polyangiaceae bacterium]
MLSARVSPRRAFAVCLGLGLWLAPGFAWARRSGLAAAGCEGCHSGGLTPKVTISTEPAVFAPGDTVTAEVNIQAVNGGPAGLYFAADLGRFSNIAGQGTTPVSDAEITHSAPRAATDGNVTFQVRWTAPATPNGVYFEAWVLASNGNGSTSGDGAGHAEMHVTFGCTGEPYFIDLDGDGFGDSAGASLIKCAPTPGFSVKGGDCNDGDRDIYPGAPERCNGKDDNCDQRVDEGLAGGSHTFYLDQDGDGYGGGSASMTVVGCQSLSGYTPLSGDCNDRDATVHPGAPEVCDLVDDNCDGRIDELVRPRCGVGWCQRLSPTCDASACVPGQPAPESCNGADDDCDGVVDDAPNLCGPGFACHAGVCSTADGASTGGVNAGGTSTGGQSAGGTSAGGASAGGASAGGTSAGGTSSDVAGGGVLDAGGGSIIGSPLPPSGSAGLSQARSAGCSVSREKQRAPRALITLLAFMVLVRAVCVRRRPAASSESPPLP